MRKLSLFIATSLDGFIAGPNDDLSFLASVEKEGEDYGYAKFIDMVDTVIVGRKTYDYVLQHIGPGHYDNGGRDVYVITREVRPDQGKVTFHSDGLIELVEKLKAGAGNTIYCDGGAETIDGLLKHDLIDEMTISVIPILLGDGTRLFRKGRPEQRLKLMDVKTFDTGLVQMVFKRKDP
ncbi:dihydrofolate reductase family protein [Echinicola vietnamensis]|uniref:Dihydrofolate reductase n=1 Tax=Echinicola vietnamensis (strain DSM 17526 / LMG 23754 / KMM 6221) TaxID=926556 RepID=L0FYC9_ECHVK|nr:dihydrofolate reductase family protein [Echinicola vietnamensis]AGA78924.1 dihydrofolate reductase [Echinicola vietnamensis DSM 17526]